ncbi:hypothetical protein COS46_00005, partial [Candidatus Jorgensenbacteria bacterium CG03_land_8_20_14_0_80_38_39]
MSSQFNLKAIKILIYGLIIGTPLIFYTHSLFPLTIPKIVFFQSVVEIIFGLWLGLIIFNKRYLPKLTPLFIALLIFFAVLSISAVFGINFFHSLWSSIERGIGIVGIFHFLFLAIVLQSIGKEINWRPLWLTSFITSAIVALGAPIQQFVAPSIFLTHSGYRPGSFFGNPTFMAGYLLFNVFIGFWLLAQFSSKAGRHSKIWCGFIVTGLVLDFFAIFLSETLGDIIGLAVGLGFLALYFLFKSRGWFRIFLLALIIGTLVLTAVFVSTRKLPFWEHKPIFQRLAGFSFTGSGIQNRFIAWRAAIEGFKERPILGWGWENFNIPFNTHYDPQLLTWNFSETYWDKPHNVYLEYLVTGGILGLLAYLGIFITLGYELFRLRRRDPMMFSFLIAASLAYLVQNAIIFDTIGTYLMFFLVIGFVDYRFSSLKSELSETRTESSDRAGKLTSVVSAISAIIFLLPIYFLNWQILRSSYYYYWGLNYLKNGLVQAADLSWQEALQIKSPYLDDVRKDFASFNQEVLKMALQAPQELLFSFLEIRHKQAIEELKKIISHQPNNYFYYVFLADFYNNFYNFGGEAYIQEALKNIDKAIELSPKRQQIYYVLARTRLLQKDTNGAFQAFDQAVVLAPEAGDPHFAYGILAYQVKDIKKGREEIAKAKALGRDVQSAAEALTLGSLVGDLENDYPRAIELFKTAIHLAHGEHQATFERS